MGDRVSIQFKKGNETSVVLFSHWNGMDLVKFAKDYVKNNLTKGTQTTPLDRREPNTVMVDFIRHLTKDERVVDSNYYLGANESEGDNSDNGHHIINL